MIPIKEDQGPRIMKVWKYKSIAAKSKNELLKEIGKSHWGPPWELASIFVTPNQKEPKKLTFHAVFRCKYEDSLPS
jgi:hypothetical protein